MKRFMGVLLSMAILFAAVFPMNAYADTGGSGNVDGGGGGMGDGTSTNSWTPGNEGVRVTVVRASDHAVVSTPIDLTNRPPNSSIYNFGKISKLQYNGGRGLSPIKGSYNCVAPPQPLPKIISTNGSNNIEAIKRYFCSEYLVQMIANHTGMSYDVLIGGEYKLLLEPIAYYKFEGVMIATTATEAALYDEQVGGLLRKRMVSLSHKNLPLSMFLEVADLGYSAWSGSRSKAASNAEIKSSLGLGIVRFKDKPAEPPNVSVYDYEYRVNTEVITAITVSGGQSDPDYPVSATFYVNGRSHRVSNIYYPDGDSQLAWIRWTTPSTPQHMTITVSVSGGGSSSKATIEVNVVDLDKNPPPNPVADDRNDSFRKSAVPNKAQQTSTSWTMWRPWWQEHWVWHSDWNWYSDGDGGGHWEDDGEWVDEGWWEFDLDRYQASLSASIAIKPDDKSPTASSKAMKSGYGINETVSARVSTNQSSAVTGAQTAVTYFPEFGYQSYWRLLERMSSGYSARFEFQKNPAVKEHDVVFSEIEETIIQGIRDAKFLIWAAVAWFSNETIFDELLAKKQQGLNIRIIISDESSNQKLLSKLKSNFDIVIIPKHGWNDYNRMHDKFCIIDLDYVMHGSYNWTPTANYNEETLATALDHDFVKKFANEFMRMFTSN